MNEHVKTTVEKTIAFNNLLRRMKESPVWNSPQVQFLDVTLSQHTLDRYNAWMEECYAKAVVKQKAETKNPTVIHQDCWDEGYPYEGAIGGGFTVEVTTTSIGQIVKVRYDYINENIDLTEYDLW